MCYKHYYIVQDSSESHMLLLLFCFTFNLLLLATTDYGFAFFGSSYAQLVIHPFVYLDTIFFD